MGKVNALEKLRTFASEEFDAEKLDSLLNEIADEIQIEVNDRFMELPVDSDGMPIHVDDEMMQGGEKIGRVTGVGYHGEPRVWILPDGKYVSVPFFAGGIKHYEPRTIEDLLNEYALQVGRSTFEKRNELTAKYAVKIHEFVS